MSATESDLPARNYLAVELRHILRDLTATAGPQVRERLKRLAEHVERLGAEPASAEHALEAIPAGLDPEQTIRDYAIGHVIARHVVNGAHVLQSQLWVQADEIAAYIRDGSRPDTAEEATIR